MYRMWIALLFVTILWCQGGWCLRHVVMSGGGAVLSGTAATLRCSYDLEGALLYSIRWYRNEDEFYRYVPKESPPTMVFSLPGIHVDLSSSNDQNVTLTGVHRQLTGIYICEISADAPLFHTEIRETTLDVVDVPESVPSMNVDRYQYTAGETIKANCSLPPSFPGANLTWYINGERVEMTHTTHFPLNPDLWEASSAFSAIEINTEYKSVLPRYQVGGSVQETSSQQLKIPDPEPEITVYTAYAPLPISSKSEEDDTYKTEASSNYAGGIPDYPLKIGPVPLKVTRVRLQPEIGTVLKIACEATIYDVYRSISDVAKVHESTLHVPLVMGQSNTGLSSCSFSVQFWWYLLVIWQALLAIR